MYYNELPWSLTRVSIDRQKSSVLILDIRPVATPSYLAVSKYDLHYIEVLTNGDGPLGRQINADTVNQFIFLHQDELTVHVCTVLTCTYFIKGNS